MEVISSKAQENRFIYMSGYPALFSFTPGRDIMTQDMTKGKIMPMLIRFTIPLVLGNLFQLTYNAVDSIIVGHFIGKEALAAVGICNPVTTLVILFLNGLCMGASILIGMYYGAKDYDRVKLLTKVFIAAATILSLLFWIPAELLPEKVLSMFITTPGVAASGATNFRIMFSTYVLQGSFLIAVTLFQSLGKANKATWLVLFRQIILFIPLCVLLPMIGGLGIRGVWLAIALTDAILVVITIAMMASEFRKMPPTSQTLR